MKKSIFAVVWVIIIALPCILMFDCGPKAAHGEESLQWTNVVGLAWFAFLVLGGVKFMMPKWMRDELKAYMGDE